MPLHTRVDGEIVVLSNFGRLMNDPRHFDAGRDVRDLLGLGFRKFVIDLSGIRETGPPLLGLLITLTRQIRQKGGEAVLTNVRQGVAHFLDEMRMDDYWDVFESSDAAKKAFAQGPRERGGSSESDPAP